MAAVFTVQTCTFPTSGYFGVDGSALQTALYSAGLVQYIVLEPNAAAVAAAGLTGRPIPCVVEFQGAGTTNLQGVGINEGAQMAEQLGNKLGYGGTPDPNFPYYVIYPQFLATAPSGSWANAGDRMNRAAHMITNAVVLDAFSKYNIDRQRVVGSAFSGGTSPLSSYTKGRARWPNRFLVDFSAQIHMAGAIASDGSNHRSTLPEWEQAENSNNQTIPRMVRLMAKMKVPTWLFNSTNDAAVVPATYNPGFVYHQQSTPLTPQVAIVAGTSAGNYRTGGGWLRITEYTGGSAPNHQGVWDLALSNNNAGAPPAYTHPLWVWAFDQRVAPRRMGLKLGLGF